MSFSVTTNVYLRNCYSDNRSLCVKSKRTDATNGTLSFADSAALKKSIRKLKDFDYESDDKTAFTHNIKAFIDAYNYTLDSAGESATKDVVNAAKHLKKTSASYEKELKKLGISMDKDGYMSISSSATTNISTSKYKEMFGEGSKYLSSLNQYSHRIQSKVDIYL